MNVRIGEKSDHFDRVKNRPWRMVPPDDDPELQRRAEQCNAFSDNLYELLTGVHSIDKLSLEETGLLCALGLPGAEGLLISDSLKTFQEWVKHVRIDTDHWLPDYYASPQEHGSLAQFKCLCMMTIVQKYLGAKYNLLFSEGDYDPRDSRDLFIHGLLTGHGGACVSMPTLLCAIGRRVGYPLFLVQSKEHTFIRWDDPSTGERFNFDGTSKGFSAHDDAHYLDHPVPLKMEDFIRFPRYMKNMTTRRQELALMLGERAQCLMFNLRPLESLIAFQYANAVDPDNRLLEENWAFATEVQKAFDAEHKRAKTELLPAEAGRFEYSSRASD
jgi:hypothetical protein